MLGRRLHNILGINPIFMCWSFSQYSLTPEAKNTECDRKEEQTGWVEWQRNTVVQESIKLHGGKKTVLNTIKAIKAGKNSQYILLAKKKEINKKNTEPCKTARNQYKKIKQITIRAEMKDCWAEIELTQLKQAANVLYKIRIITK